MPNSSTQTPNSPRSPTPSPSLSPDSQPTDFLYSTFEATINTLETLLPPLASPNLLTSQSASFLDYLLESLLRWGVDVYTHSGSSNGISGGLVGECTERILENMRDCLERLVAVVQRHYQGDTRGQGMSTGTPYNIPRLTRQRLSQGLVNLRGFNRIIFDAHVRAGLASAPPVVAEPEPEREPESEADLEVDGVAMRDEDSDEEEEG